MSYKSCRVAAEKTQEEAANHVGVTKYAVCGWEAGRFSPTAKRLSGLAEFYGCTVDELLKEEKEEQ